MTRYFLAAILSISLLLPAPASALVTAFRQAIAEGVAEHEDMAEFYRERAFEPIWTRTEDAARRNALLMALEGAANHGLPAGRYDPDALRAAFMDADNPYNRGQAEIMASAMFLRYAHDVQSGILDPGEIVREIHRDLPRRDPTDLLQSLVDADPYEVMRALPPAHPEYLRLQRELL
ncbi:MAG: murein L,D-transpeptidase, partial [bacterium]|nr:murein L,D-transpeptidase [bacterium]